MSDEKLNIYAKLQKIRVELQNKKIKKSGKNAYAGFTYYELKDFLPAINELMLKYGVSSNFSIDEGRATLTIINLDDTKDVICFVSPTEEAQLKGCTPIQALGAVHTYMKRYLYLNAFEIVEDDLLDAQAGNIKPIEEKEDPPKEVENKNTNRYFCSNCGKEITKKVAEFSNSKFGTELCYNCQDAFIKGEI